MALDERLHLGLTNWSPTETPVVPDQPASPSGATPSSIASPALSSSMTSSPMITPAAFNMAFAAPAGAETARAVASAPATSGQSFNYQIQYSDPGNYAGTLSSVIETDMNAALQNFEGNVYGAGTLVVQLNIVASNSANAGELADGGPSALMPTGTADGRTLEASAALYELQTGTHVQGFGSDIIVNIPSSALGQLYFDANPAAGDTIASAAPSDYDGITVFRHELTHGLGFISLRDTSTGTLGAAETGFDHYTSITSSNADYFIGPAARAVYGGPVPITTLQNGEQYSHLGNTANGPLANDLMSGTGLMNGVTHQVSALDFTILRDSGVPESGTMPCFAAGTRIATVHGEVAVDQLRSGDLVLLEGGGTAPVIWIGSRKVDIAGHPDPEQVAPILITAGAIADATPKRDLQVSPDHALFFNDTLIPAKALLNGVTVRQVHPSMVVYVHIELAAHDIILAEGVPVETYLDTGNRATLFANGQARGGMDQTTREQGSCAPVAETGAVVAALRTQILERAAIATTADPDLSISIGHTGLCTDLLTSDLMEVVLPAEASDLVISSRYFVPGEVTADPRDRRQLGVSVSALELQQDGCWRTIALNDPALAEGWHSAEPGHRWTNGRGIIPARSLAGASRLRMRFQAASWYRQAA